MPEKRDTMQPSALGALKSTEGITKSLATLAGLYVAYRAASAVSDYFGNAKVHAPAELDRGFRLNWTVDSGRIGLRIPAELDRRFRPIGPDSSVV